MTLLPLTWEPVGLEEVLPRLDANIELGFLGEDRTQLAISARYRPLLGVLGRTVDRVLLHRVAEAAPTTEKDGAEMRRATTCRDRLSRPDRAGTMPS